MTHTAVDRRFKRNVLSQSPGLRRWRRQMIVAAAVSWAIFVPLFGGMTGLVLWLWFGGYIPADEWPMMLLAVAVTSFLTVTMMALPLTGWITLRREWRTRRSIAEVAEEIGWCYEPEVSAREYNGLLFRVGNGRVENGLHRHQPRFLNVGNYSYSTSHLENPRTNIGFVLVELPRRLPHMYLQSRSRKTQARAMQIPFGQDQRLSLEGDFDRWFHLYCPREYERDALYIFTPDLMVALIDAADGFDVEVIDNCLYVYAREAFDVGDPGCVGFAERISAVLGDGTARQSRRYADERASSPALVHESGARLRWSRKRILGVSTLAWAAGWAAAFGVMYLSGRLPF